MPPPAGYQVPTGNSLADYLLRLEQTLAVGVCNADHGREEFLHGQREMLLGCLQLCLADPANATTRLLLAGMFAALRKCFEYIAGEFADKIRRLQAEHPLPPRFQQAVDQVIAL
jgi:hypothetical protein